METFFKNTPNSWHLKLSNKNQLNFNNQKLFGLTPNQVVPTVFGKNQIRL